MPEGLVKRAQMQENQAQAGMNEAGEGEPNLTPEEQETYDSAMQMTGELLYNNDESHNAIMGLLKEDDPAGSVADATTFVLSKIEETYQGNYPEELVLPTADEISDLVLELADEAGVFKVDEKVATDAKSMVSQQLIEDYGVDEQGFAEASAGVTSDEVAEYEKMFGGQNG